MSRKAWIHPVIAGVIVLVTGAVGDLRVPGLAYRRYSDPGDVTLLGFFPLHRYSARSHCGDDVRNIGPFQRMEAMVYAVDKINRDAILLPGLKLGYVIVDDCSKAATALAIALDLLGGPASQCRNGTNPNPNVTRVVGVVAADFSSISVLLASLLGVLNIPQISYYSTSDTLSDKESYPYFLRVIPPDKYQLEAIAELIETFNWTYVSVLYVDDVYGMQGFLNLQRPLSERGICMAFVKKIKKSFSTVDYDDVGRELHSGTYIRAKAVILFTYSSQARSLWAALSRGGYNSNFTWIGGDGWGEKQSHYNGHENVAQGALTLRFSSKPVPEVRARIESYTRGSSPNPWFDEVLNHHYWYRADSNSSANNEEQYSSFRNDSSYASHPMESLVVDTVYAYAHALNQSDAYSRSTNKSECWNSSEIVCLRNLLFRQLSNLSFEGRSGHVSFDSQGNGLTNYEVLNMKRSEVTGQGSDDSFHIETIGQYLTSEWRLIIDKPLYWAGGGVQQTPPVSRCSAPCLPTQGQVKDKRDPACCWLCEDCKLDEIVVESDKNGQPVCQLCEAFHRASSDHVTCHRIEADRLQRDEPLSVVLTSTAACGVLVTMVISGLLLHHRKHPVIKAASRELIFFIAIGVELSFIVVYFLLEKPDDISCLIGHVGAGLCFSAIYGPLAVKQIRMFRIFKSAKNGAVTLRGIHPVTQISLSLSIVLAHIIGTVVCLLIEPIRGMEVMTSSMTSEFVCIQPVTSLIFSLSFVGCLLLVNSFLAFKNRRLPDNFNESKFILFCVYTTLVMWLATIPSKFIDLRHRYQVVFQCLGLVCNAIVILFSMYVSKLYMVFFPSRSHRVHSERSR